MRLLKREQSDGVNTSSSFSLINFPPSNIPSVYAILSHRWGDDEVTLKDLESGTARAKPGGYRKLEFCAKQAARDGILYFWIDTCCIDKANNTELSEAINSMFKWYQNAAKCYVYLPDVSLNLTNSIWLSAFQASSWFTRGWTLQELIAPRTVEFFSVDGTRLGDKISLEQQIHHVTKIPIEAFRGSSLTLFAPETRFAWAAGRHTTVDEDAAYCLLGLFDVHMPLLYGEGRRKALARLRRKIEKSSRPVASNTASPLQTVPFERNPRFTGREAELAELEARLFAPDHTSIWIINGLGGVGKTQLVLELLYRTQIENPDCTVMWISAATRQTLHQGYSAVAQQLNIPGCEDENADIETLVQNYLTNVVVGRWVLVFDNADDINLWIKGFAVPGQESVSRSSTRPYRLMDHLPRNRRGSIIFTTRDKKLATHIAGPRILTVSELGEHAAEALLGKYLSEPSFLVDHQQDAARLLERLTYLPLAIAQAATYIVKNSITIAEYLQLLENKEEEVIDLLSADFEDHGRYREIKNPIATTWLISFEQIQEYDQLAAEYLSFMACIHPKDIPRSLLPRGPSQQRELEAIGALTAYSFVSRSPTGESLSLHRLVHLATRNWLRKEEALNPWLRKTVIRLEEVFPSHDDQYRDISRTYLPHALQVLESNGFHRGGDRAIALMSRCGTRLYEDGRWNEAEMFFNQALVEEESSLIDNDTSKLSIKVWLATIYRRQGRWAEAEKLAVQALETMKVKLGSDHPEILKMMDSLASTYESLGRWTEAEELHKEVLQRSRIQLGTDHQDTLSSMNNLASIYHTQGRQTDAEKLLIEALEKSKTKLGINHPDTLTTMDNLASIYEALGRWTEAEELHKDVLQRFQKSMGTDHPDSMMIRCNLARVYWLQKRFAEAEELEVEVVETNKRMLGANHPDTLISMLNLTCMWKDMGRDDEATQLLEEVVQQQAQVIGVQHPVYRDSVTVLRRWEAEKLSKTVSQKPSLGSKHQRIKLSHRFKNFWRSSPKTDSSARG